MKHALIPTPGRGFTLIELLISLAILGILASLAWPALQLHTQRRQEEELRYALRQLRTAIDRYKDAVDAGLIPKRNQDDSGYPPTLDILVQGVEVDSPGLGIEARVDIPNPNIPNPNNPNTTNNANRIGPKKRLVFLRRIPRDPMQAQGPTAWGLRSHQSPPDQPQPGADVFDVYSLSTKVGRNGIPYAQW